jgi:iron complex outermembrane receptor protein
VALALGSGSAAFAQEEETTASEGARRDEIVVSARRREESLQDVPIAVTSFSGDQLEKIAAPDITYLNQAIPNVTIERSRSTNSTLTAFIRGVGQQDPVAGFEQGVGIYIDDVYLNRPQGSILDIYDVERIEVLRGPQGTLYGRNTIGGAIKYVTRRLDDDPMLRLRAAGGTYGQADVVATFGLPITEELKIGGAFARLTRNGFGENLVQQGLDNYDKDVLAGRFSVEWTPVEQLFLRLSGDWTRDSSDPRQGHRLLDSQFNVVGGVPVYPVLDNVFDTRADLDNPRNPVVLNRGVTLLGEFELNDTFTLKNIVAYRDNRSDQQIDFDSLPVVDLQSPFTLTDTQFSEEFQVLFDAENVAGVAGFYYLDANAFNAFDVLLGQTATLLGLPGVLNAFTLGEVDTQTWSVFGDVTFDVGEMFDLGADVEISVGGRYTEDERTGQVLRQTLLGNAPMFGGAPILLATTSNFNGNVTFDDFTPRASIAWKPTPDQNLYFSWGQGFKGGGFDPRGQSTAAPDLNSDGMRSPEEIFDFFLFEPEEITTYEVGLKSTWADGRATTNLAVFYSDYSNVQIPGSIGVDTNNDGIADNFTGVTTNAGKAEFKGVEFEGSATLAEDMSAAGDSLSTNWAVGWIDAEYKEFFAAVAGPGGTSIQNIADQRFVQNTPEWTAHVSLNYTRPLQFWDTAGEISLIPSVSYRSSTHQFEFASPIDQAGYALVDASLVWRSDNGRFEVGVHGKNLTDKLYKVAGYDFVTFPPRLGLDGTLTAFFGDPRTVTGTIQVAF